MLVGKIFTTARHTTYYWEAGPAEGPLMIFLHGWPGIGLLWREQLEAFAEDGWHCIAPDMRGYGDSSAPLEAAAYKVREIVGDMVELHDHLGGRPAIWVGHDWGSPISGAIAAHHAERAEGIVLISIPYFPDGFGLPNLVPLVDRDLYPAGEHPDGQWDYYRFYLTHFEQTVDDFEADISAALAGLYRPGNPASEGKVSPSALVTKNGGRYGAAHRAPAVLPDPSIWPAADFEVLVQSFGKTGFRPANSWYLNDDANIAYAAEAPDGGRLNQPVLYINGTLDTIANIDRGPIGDPMRTACRDLTVANITGGHWLPLERKMELVQTIRAWLNMGRRV
jgi:pimeloyl-ACP methyl ester carboxylesterase